LCPKGGFQDEGVGEVRRLGESGEVLALGRLKYFGIETAVLMRRGSRSTRTGHAAEDGAETPAKSGALILRQSHRFERLEHETIFREFETAHGGISSQSPLRSQRNPSPSFNPGSLRALSILHRGVSFRLRANSLCVGHRGMRSSPLAVLSVAVSAVPP
jgi:hypothetical protein